MKMVMTALALLMPFGQAQAGDSRPNVLFITVDDMNVDLGAWGHPQVKSPNIDALAAGGVRFDKAYAQYPVCTPSRTSFLTGTYPEQNGVLTNGVHFRDIIPKVITLPQHFRNNGYYTARVGKIYHYRVPEDIGTNGLDDEASWDERRNPRGADRDVEDQLNSIFPEGDIGATLSWLEVGGSDEEQTDGLVASNAIDMISSNHPDKTGKPFFLAVGFFRPHVPFVATKKFYDMYPLESVRAFEIPEDDRDDIPVWALNDRPKQDQMSERTEREMIRGYWASISFVDAQIGKLVTAVNDMGLADETIIVFMSDHGFHLGQHDLWQKGDLFEGSAHAPLIISVPGKNANTVTTPVEFIDLYPTLVELTGLDKPTHLQGRSLTRLLDDPGAAHRGSAFSMNVSRAGQTRPELRRREVLGHSIRTERFRYTEWAGGSLGIELYDYEKDPLEVTNVAGKGDYYKTIQMKLRRLLEDRRTAASEPIGEIE